MSNYRRIQTYLTKFCISGGVEVICRSLVNSNSRIISTSPSLISTIMQNLNGKSKIAEKRLASLEMDSADGMQNFAPLGEYRKTNFSTLFSQVR